MTTALQTMRENYAQRDKAARDWKARGGKVVGYVCEVVPEELIAAAGFMPYRVSGDPLARDQAVLDKYLNSIWPASDFYTRHMKLEAVASIFQLLVSGRYDFLDYLVIPNTKKGVYLLHRLLKNARKYHPDLRIPELHLLDRTLTPFFASRMFNRARIIDFRKKLEEWSGRPITDAAMAAEVAASNEGKALLDQVTALRTARPPRISGAEALQIFGSAKFMPRRDHNELLRQFLADAAALPARSGKRVFVGGSAADNLQLCEIIEAAGGTVVGEDHCWGERCTALPISTRMEPLEAIADRYVRLPACSVRFPMSRSVEHCTARAKAAAADAAIFNVFRDDNAQVYDIPDQMKGLREIGIPSLYLQEQPYRITDAGSVRSVVRQFLDAP